MSRQTPLGELAEPKGLVGGPFGSSLGSKDYEPTGVPVIRGSNMGHGRYLGGDFVYVSEDKFHRDLARNTAAPGDVMFTQRGTLGQVAMVPVGGPGLYVVSQSQMRMRVDIRRADPRFIYYACSAPAFLRQVADHAISTGVPHINLGILAKLRVPEPPVREQRAIAEVLGALDDKIAANATLVSKADELIGTTYASLVAEGVEVPLSSLAEFINGKAFTKNATGTGRVVVRIAELNSGISGSTVYNDIDVPDRHLARPGDLLFAWSGSLTVRRWFRPEAIVNQHIFKVVPRDVPMWVVKGALDAKLAQFRAIAADKATTMGHIQRRHLDEPVAVPSEDGIARHDASMSALWHRALLAERESMQLGVTRDALLPGLMSGKIRVKDAEQAVGDVI